MCNLCAKGFFDYEFNSADIDKISNFNEIASNFTYLCTSKFIKYNLTDTDHLLLKSKFYGRGKSGMYFCIFGSCQPLRTLSADIIALPALWSLHSPLQTVTLYLFREIPIRYSGHNFASYVKVQWITYLSSFTFTKSVLNWSWCVWIANLIKVIIWNSKIQTCSTFISWIDCFANSRFTQQSTDCSAVA